MTVTAGKYERRIVEGTNTYQMQKVADLTDEEMKQAEAARISSSVEEPMFRSYPKPSQQKGKR